MEVIDVRQLRDVIKDGDSIAATGFSKSGMPFYLFKGIEDSFLECGHPCDLEFNCVAMGGVNIPGTYHDHFGHRGLLSKIRVSHIALAPGINEQIDNNIIPGYMYPLGVLAQLYRDMGAGKPGVISKVGLGTYVDPRQEGGRMNSISVGDVAKLIKIDGEEWLFYPKFGLDVALIKATYADTKGNISLDKEPCKSDAFIAAQAVKQNGGTVIVQVEEIVDYPQIPAREVEIPDFQVDYVVIEPVELRRQTAGTVYEPALCQKERADLSELTPKPLNIRKIIARRATMELNEGDRVNLGYGIPELCGDVAAEEGMEDAFTLTVECGLIGGVPGSGWDFGAARNADYVTDIVGIMDWYDGGGLDSCVLGMAEVDSTGNVNVTKFGSWTGPGGFINITNSAETNVFCGTMTAGGLKVAASDGRLEIVQEGKKKKFVNKVEQISFNALLAKQAGHSVIYITERAVFELTDEGLVLTEIAPGIDLETQILSQIDFDVKIAADLKEMDPRIFTDEPMGLSERGLSK